MAQNTQAKSSKSQKIDVEDIVKSINLFFSKMPQNDKIAYGLIVLGVIFVIISIILW